MTHDRPFSGHDLHLSGCSFGHAELSEVAGLSAYN